MATYRGIITPTPVTVDMVRQFIETYPGGRWVDGTAGGGYIEKGGRTVCVSNDTRLFPLSLSEESIEACRTALGAEPESYVSVRVLLPRDNASFALAEEVAQAMLARWSGLRVRDIFGEDD
jgi:hypothetical protein